MEKKSKESSKKSPRPKVRVKLCGKIKIDNLPKRAAILFDLYKNECIEGGTKWETITIEETPPSLNHNVRSGYDANKGKRVFFRSKTYEEFLKIAWLNSRLKSFKSSGVVAALIIFESPNWLNKNSVRIADIDNKIKPTLDSIKDTLKFDDSLVWELFAVKAQSKKRRTWIILFDLGDIVESYSMG